MEADGIEHESRPLDVISEHKGGHGMENTEPFGKSARMTWLVVAFLPLSITVKPGPWAFFLGRYSNDFSCSAMRSTGEPFLNPRNDLSKLWSEPALDEVDADALLAERLEFDLLSPVREVRRGCRSE